MIELKPELFVDTEIISLLAKADEEDIRVVEDFLRAILSFYEKSANGETLLHYLSTEWNIFQKDQPELLTSVLAQLQSPFQKEERVCYIQELKECINQWESIKTEVKTNKRFFCDLSPIEDLLNSFTPTDFFRDEILYRARIHHKDEKTFMPNEMGCPTDPQKIIAGRANPHGIPYLYLCKDIETPLYEVRPTYLDHVDIGKFRVKVDCLHLMDFTQEFSLFHVFYECGEDVFKENVKRKILFDSISKDLSTPLRRYDTEIEYIPTQYICEYYKKEKLDGIIFMSSVHPEGKNIVLFDDSTVSCEEVLPYEVKNLTLKMRQLDTI